jgi:hypothetical protein
MSEGTSGGLRRGGGLDAEEGPMATRRELLERIAKLAGEDVLHLEDASSGWPGYGEVLVDGEAHPVALYVGPLGLSHPGRDAVERRFQNPGADRPISDTRPVRLPLLLGLWEEDGLLDMARPVLVSADPYRRVGHTTRFSVFADVPTLVLAGRRGWAEDFNEAGERVTAFFPELLSVSVEASREHASPSPDAIRTVVAGSGLLEAGSDSEFEEAAERVRRTGTSLVRKAGFGRRVVDAYGGACAMCGLSWGFPEGAHIYPAAAPGSTDQLANGLSLCPNHHRGFDRHLIGVEPSAGEIRVHADLAKAAESQDAAATLLKFTSPKLTAPVNPSAAPTPEMFVRRYAYFAPFYEWLRV